MSTSYDASRSSISCIVPFLHLLAAGVEVFIAVILFVEMNDMHLASCRWEICALLTCSHSMSLMNSVILITHCDCYKKKDTYKLSTEIILSDVCPLVVVGGNLFIVGIMLEDV
jgi:hypothetical protein